MALGIQPTTSLVQLKTEFERWLTATQDLSDHSVRAYADDVEAFHRFLGPHFCVTTLSSTDLYGFIEHLVSRGLSSTSTRRRLSGVRRYCRWLTQTGMLGKDPCADLSVRFGRGRRLPRALPRGELQRLIHHLTERAEEDSVGPDTRMSQMTTLLAVALMVGTGIRVGELVNLRCPDLDLPSRTIRVLGKGQRERLVYLTNERIAVLMSLYADLCAVPHAIDNHLLLNRAGRQLSTATLRARVARAGAEAGLESVVTPHMLRHSAATQLIECGVDIRFVQRLLGHASLTTTEIYTHVADVSLRRAVTQADVLGMVMTSR